MRHLRIVLAGLLILAACNKTSVEPMLTSLSKPDQDVSNLLATVMPVVNNLRGKYLHELADNDITDADLESLAIKMGLRNKNEAQKWFLNYDRIVKRIRSRVAAGELIEKQISSVTVDAQTLSQCQDAAVITFVGKVFGVGVISAGLKEAVLSTLGKFSIWSLEVGALLGFINDMNQCAEKYPTGATCSIFVSLFQDADKDLFFYRDTTLELSK